MKKILIPLILLLAGVGGGVGAGLALVPAKPELASAEPGPCGDTDAEHGATDDEHADGHGAAIGDSEYAKLNNQFIVPVVRDGAVKSLIVIALSIEVKAGQKEAVFLAEPKLRDAFLQAMFDHANIGGFDGNFTSATNMRPLREELGRRGQRILPDIISDVLIVDIVRQDS